LIDFGRNSGHSDGSCVGGGSGDAPQGDATGSPSLLAEELLTAAAVTATDAAEVDDTEGRPHQGLDFQRGLFALGCML
jgi:hypothetical protein